MTRDPSCPFVSRGGLKLLHALDEFKLDVTGLTCADLGCSTGGFTDCLLQAGAARIFSVDTGYGVLDYKLRKDPRVTAMERTNALHATPPETIDLVVMDLSWTPQKHAVPAALKWIKDKGRIITLIKPHYERTALDPAQRGIMEDAEAERVAREVIAAMPALGVRVLADTPSPIRGSGGKHKEGNLEWLALLERAP
jgi:23S rRNA (cytidine1920-2'-O)/16S rRNA (cytidine1409-2'-O)-methyltransferase